MPPPCVTDPVARLPAEYKQLEARVDALRDVHVKLLKITKVYETESVSTGPPLWQARRNVGRAAEFASLGRHVPHALAGRTYHRGLCSIRLHRLPACAALRVAQLTTDAQYDYPSDVTENLSEYGQQAQAAWSSFANKNLKNTALAGAVPAEKPKSPHPPKTLPHAISRAAKTGADELGADDRLGNALNTYGVALEKVGDARIAQDQLIAERFVTPWQATLSTSIGLAMKARAAVKTARLELDSARSALKAAGAPKQEQAR